MRRFLLISALALAIAVPAFAGTGNWITNGDFENGLAGWESGSLAAGYLEPTAFDSAGGVLLKTYDGSTQGPAEALAPYQGTSAGWARTGLPTDPVHNWTYISQTVNCLPGTYTLDQNATQWQAIAGTTGSEYCFAAMFLVRVDDQIDMVYDQSAGTYTFRSTKWDFQEPKSGWTTKSFSDSSFTTTQGRVQFILAFEDQAGNQLTDWYGYAAFDNVVFETNEEFAPVPEPSSMLALGTGLFGLAGFAIRRRK